MSHTLDEEVLESLTFERSKTWSNFLMCCEEKDDNIEIALSDIEEIFKDEDKDDSISARAEAEESDVEDDINNTTQCMSKAELTLMLRNGDNKDILDHTMPIVEEHVRKWKEAGLDRILNTFDTQKIEQHVGDWLRRHNSAYGDKTLLQVLPPNTCQKRYKTINTSSSSEDSEAESMHSVETARYIRDSRKRTISTATKCRSPMTKIKMYRTLPRKRAELRAKYACHEFNEEQEHRHHMQSLLQRRKQLHRRQRERELIYHTSPRHYPYSVASSFSAQQLRKRRDVSRGFPTSSSSDDEHETNRCACSPCARSAISKTAYPYYTYHSYQSRSHSHSYRDYHHSKRLELGSRSMASMVHFKRSVRQLRRQQAFEEDLRPRMVENECSCCNNDRLCTNVVHIANSSTDEWLVENKSSPDPAQYETPKKCKLQPTNRPKTFQQKMHEKVMKSVPSSIRKKTPVKTLTLPEEDEELLEEPKATFNIPKSITKAKATVTFTTVEHTPRSQPSNKNPTPKATTSKSTSLSSVKKEKSLPTTYSLNENTKESNNAKAEQSIDKDDTTQESKEKRKGRRPGRNLTKGSSLKSNNSEERTEVKQSKKKAQIIEPTESDEDFNQNLTHSRRTNTRLKGKSSKKKTQIIESSESDDDLKKALAISKETYVAELEKLKLETELQKINDTNSASPQLPEQSIFNNHSVACNSTALTNDTACSRALQSNKIVPPIEPIVAASASMEVIDLCKSAGNLERDADCTMVTSTTGCEAGGALQDPTIPPERPHFKISKKGVLLYEPPQSTANTQSQNVSSSNISANFTLTEQILSPIIGQRRARKFLKYYTGSCSFDSRYYVYYRPPGKLLAALSSDTQPLDLNSSSSSSGSDDDIFEMVERYGVIHTMLEKSN